MTEIVPAILAKTLEDITAHLERIRGAVKRVQIDVVDGAFAHGKTWPYKDGGSYEKLLADGHGLPFWDEFDFEFDLMVNEPKERASEVSSVMASHIVIHAGAPGALEALRSLAEFKDDDYRQYTVVTGVALPCSAQPELLDEFEGLYDYAQVMGIERVGRQGEPFDKRALYLVERLRKRNSTLTIQVDGGVSLENASALTRAGANRLIAGSAVFGAEDPAQAILKLQAEANRT